MPNMVAIGHPSSKPRRFAYVVCDSDAQYLFNGPLNPFVNGSSEMGGLIPGLLSAWAQPAPVITPTV
jgi:hypothetical protein